MIIVVIAGAKGSGKTEAARALNGVRFSFGDPMKKMLMTIGVPIAALWGNDEAKSQPQEVLGGKSTRHAMVTLATEWGRDLIDYDIWVKAMNRYVEEYEASNPRHQMIVIDDLRFVNELEWARKRGAIIFGIERGEPRKLPKFWEFWKKRPHISEQLPCRFEELGIQVIKNDSTIADLHRKVIALTTPPP